MKVTTSKNNNILVGAFYRKPKSLIETLTELDISLSKIENSEKYRNCEIFLGGDFNLRDIDWEHGYPITGAKDKSHCEKLSLSRTSKYTAYKERQNFRPFYHISP